MAGAGELSMILDNTPFLLTRCSRDLRYLYVSKAYAEMLGRSRDEIIGRPIMDIIGPKAAETIRPYVDAVLRGRRVEYETVVNYLNVGPRHMHVTYVPERDEESRVFGWIASIREVTLLSSGNENDGSNGSAAASGQAPKPRCICGAPAALLINHDWGEEYFCSEHFPEPQG